MAKRNRNETKQTETKPRNRSRKGNTPREVETVTAADVATVDASDLTTQTETAVQAINQPETAGDETMPEMITLTKRFDKKNGGATYGANGLRGLIKIPKAMLPASGAPAEIQIPASLLATPDAAAAEKAAKKAANREKTNLSTAARAEKLQARIAKQEAQARKNAEKLQKLQARLAKGEVTAQQVTEAMVDGTEVPTETVAQ
jgi:hypothetical protein